MIYIVFHQFNFVRKVHTLPYFHVIYGIITLALWYFIYWVSHELATRDHQNIQLKPIVITCTIVTLLLWIDTVSILMSLSLLVLAYLKRDRVLTIMAIYFLSIFLSSYYYALVMSLMLKSFVLIASGTLLLLSRFYLLKSSPQSTKLSLSTSIPQTGELL